MVADVLGEFEQQGERQLRDGLRPVSRHIGHGDAARAGGFASVGAMCSANAPHWKPALPLAEIADECLTEAAKLREALTPTLRRGLLATTMAEITEDGLRDYERVFGHRISASSLYRLVERTARRDSGLDSYDRLELYLPDRLTRRQAALYQQSVNELEAVLRLIPMNAFGR